MDNDGDLDMVTARVINDGPVTPLDQDLLWFENDGTPESREQWKMHRIAGELIFLIRNFNPLIWVYYIPEISTCPLVLQNFKKY